VIEFLQAYGSWILIGLFFLFMMRMHGGHGGSGCGMGGHDHSSHQSDEGQPVSVEGDESESGQSSSCH
jgi:hypothetical protein